MSLLQWLYWQERGNCFWIVKPNNSRFNITFLLWNISSSLVLFFLHHLPHLLGHHLLHLNFLRHLFHLLGSRPTAGLISLGQCPETGLLICSQSAHSEVAFVNDQQSITWLLCKTVIVPVRIHSQKLFGCRLEVGLPLKGWKEVETLLFYCWGRL